MAKKNLRDGTRYDPDYHPEHAAKYCLLGATNADLGRMFEVQEETVEKWMRQHREFRDAINEGRELADADVAHSMYRRAKGWSHRATKIMQYEGQVITKDYIERYPADVRAGEFWLTNRQPDKWKHKVEHSGDPNNPIKIERIERIIVDP